MVYPFLSLGLPNPGTLGVSSTGDLGGGDRSAFAIAVRLSLRPKGPTGNDLEGITSWAERDRSGTWP